MNMKKILLLAIVLLIAVSSLGMLSAGGSDNHIEGFSFKFAVPDGYSGERIKTGVILTKDDDVYNKIKVDTLSSDNYTDFMNSESGLRFAVASRSGNTAEDSYEVVKDFKEGDMRIVVQNNSVLEKTFTNGVIKKDGKYYYVSLIRYSHLGSVDSDVEIVKGILNSIEKT